MKRVFLIVLDSFGIGGMPDAPAFGDVGVNTLAACAASLEGVSVKHGVIASGDKFMSDAAEKQRIASLFGAVACEMEGAAIGQVCYVNQVPCAVMRAISDGGDEAAAIDYPTFAKMAAERAVCAIDTFFSHVGKSDIS